MKQTEIKVGAIYTNENGEIVRVIDHYDGNVFCQHIAKNTGAVVGIRWYREDSFLKYFTLSGEDMHHLGIGTVLQSRNESSYRKVLNVSSDGNLVCVSICSDTYKKAEKYIQHFITFSVDELIKRGWHIATPDTTEQMNTEEAEKALLALGRKVKIVE